MTIREAMFNEEESDDFDESEVGEYDSDGSSTGACPRCGVSPVLADGMGAGTCGHYLALYDSWGGQDDFSQLPTLPHLGMEWQTVCASLFPVVEDAGYDDVFAPHPILSASLGADLPLLNAWAANGLCAMPTWDESTRDLLLTEENGVEAIGYNTGTVFYASDGGAKLKSVVSRLAEGFEALATYLKPARTMAWTPLHFAALEEDASELVRSALARGADPNEKDVDGHTPLMMSAAIGDLGAVRVLLAAGADANAANNEGRTAWDFAREEEYMEILSVLADSGAERRW
jgi:hypothetical protein